VQIFSRAPGRSIPRQARSVASTRQFGTTLKANGRPFHCAYPIGISSQPILLSSTRQARFASTGSGPSPAEPAASSSSSFSTPSDLPSDFSLLSDLDGESLLNTPETIGYLHNLGLDYGWGPTAVCQWVVEHLHIVGGVPWWASIVGVTVILRLVMAKPALVAQQEGVKMNKMREDPLFNLLQQKFTTAAFSGKSTPPAEMLQLRQQMNLIRERYDVKTWKTFLPMLQVPFAFGMFRLTNGMASLPVPGLDTAGILWFTDLTAPDPYLILPLVGSVMMYLGMKASPEPLHPPPLTGHRLSAKLTRASNHSAPSRI
jgi:YidC/Oxa1 family membrane protein insertase